MLQIITGKFFKSNAIEDINVMRQRGILYTNCGPVFPESIATAVGTILPATTWGEVASLAYEVDEKLENKHHDGSKSILYAVGLDSFLQDFAAVTSFALNITCSPDLDLVRRLTQAKHPPLGVPGVPQKYVSRVFDQQINFVWGEEKHLQDFIKDLVGLDRRTYKAAMRAIRRYVIGLHRIGDDLDLAYTLLVASIESLAQGFDQFESKWENYNADKRHEFDVALKGAPPEIVERVRNTILKQEHASLARRYCEFALSHTRPAFFREEAVGRENSVRHRDLSIALKNSYNLRSGYIHELRELPKLLTAVPYPGDVYPIGTKDGVDEPHLTFHGMARVARHVIGEFISRTPKVEKEEFNYFNDLPNRITVKLAPRYWIWQREGYDHESARRRLSAFLSDVTSVLKREKGAGLVDMSAVLEEIEKRVPGLGKTEQRLPMLTLYLLYHTYLVPQCHRPNWETFLEKYLNDFDPPSLECLIAQTLTRMEPEPAWTLEHFAEMRAAYFKQRFKPKGLSFGAFLEAAVTLFVAEKYRQADQEEKARELVSEAIENSPGETKLLEFENQMLASPVPPIVWVELLLPPTLKTEEQPQENTSAFSQADTSDQTPAAAETT